MSDNGYAPDIALDFDGVIHSYVSDWKGADIIPDPPVYGARGFLDALLNEHVVNVFICSARFKSQFGAGAVARYLLERVGIEAKDIDWASVRALDEDSFDWAMGKQDWVLQQRWVYPHPRPIRFALEKPAAVVYVDYRGYRFEGVFPDPKELLAMQPWNKHPACGRFIWPENEVKT